ncbi:unnamed protein product [Laminaria digitata]
MHPNGSSLAHAQGRRHWNSTNPTCSQTQNRAFHRDDIHDDQELGQGRSHPLGKPCHSAPARAAVGERISGFLLLSGMLRMINVEAHAAHIKK